VIATSKGTGKGDAVIVIKKVSIKGQTLNVIMMEMALKDQFLNRTVRKDKILKATSRVKNDLIAVKT